MIQPVVVDVISVTAMLVSWVVAFVKYFMKQKEYWGMPFCLGFLLPFIALAKGAMEKYQIEYLLPLIFAVVAGSVSAIVMRVLIGRKLHLNSS